MRGHKLPLLGPAAVVASLLLSGCLFGFAQSRMTVRSQTHRDVSPPLRDMISLTPRLALTKHESQPLRRIPLPPGLNTQLNMQQEDSVRQQTMVPFTPVVGSSFEGLGAGQYGFSVSASPPDTSGAVGATQYVQWVNTSFAIFNKTTGALIAGPTAGGTLWAGFTGGCQTNNDGDPIVLYDKLAQRWIFSQFSVSTTPYLQCIAVSTTSDATGTYNRYSFQYTNFDDYPKMGVWPDGYYETFNMFNGNTFVGADACAYNRVAMLAGLSATQVCFQQNSSVGGLLPSDLDGATAPPVGSPNYMLYFGTNSLNLFKFHVDFATPGNSTFIGPTVIGVAAFTPLCNGGTCVVQPGTSQQLDSVADRLMYRLAYRNLGTQESLVTNHSVAVSGGGGGVRWYEIQNPSGTPLLAQQGTFAPDASYRWMGSIAMDRDGNTAMGYSVSSASINPSIRYTGRVPNDPAGTMQAEVNAVTGTGSQTTGLSRWGDYSALTVDPVDDCTFWYTQEYLQTNGTFNWNTRIANFKFPTCNALPDYTIGALPSSLTVTQGANGTSTIAITSLNGFNAVTALSATGLPSGVSAGFSTTPVTPPSNSTTSSTLTLTASGTATTGTTNVTVTGTSGSLSHVATVALTVNSSGTGLQTAVFDPVLKAPTCPSVAPGCDSGPTMLLGRDTLSAGAEPNQPNNIKSVCGDGKSGVFHSDESNDRLAIFTLDGSPMAPGMIVTVSATVWAYSVFAADALDLYYTANASSPSWVLIGTIVPTAAGAQTISRNYTLPSGALQAVRANYRYKGAASSCSTGAYDDHDDLIFAVGAGTPAFTIAATPSAVDVNQGRSSSSTIALSSQGGFNSATTLSLSALPNGVTAAFSTNPVTPPANSSLTSTLTFTASSIATVGTTNITVTGTAGLIVQTTTIALTVSLPGGALTAIYDPTLKAPKCTNVGASCDSGPTLLLGRGTMAGGAEATRPNTVNGACLDGNSGTFHSDESNDRLSIASTSGNPLTHGTTATVTATVWAWNTGAADSLDLYYAANAASPTWILIATIVPSAGGAQTISRTFTLPTGSMQAVRANYRYQGTASSCTAGAYNDHDDLIFAVN
jgi:hypothetical protein